MNLFIVTMEVGICWRHAILDGFRWSIRHVVDAKSFVLVDKVYIPQN